MSREQRLKSSCRQVEQAIAEAIGNLDDPAFVEEMNNKLHDLHLASIKDDLERQEILKSWSSPSGFINYATYDGR
jgi:hypothetical protein